MRTCLYFAVQPASVEKKGPHNKPHPFMTKKTNNN